MYKLLIVDDEPIAVKAVTFMVSRNFGDQFQIKTCASGKKAVELAAEFYPDIVIMDVDMPGISGIEAIRRIQAQNSNAVFVILSAYDYFDYAQEAMKLGVIEYLLKPLNEENLCNLLRSLLDRLDSIKEKEHDSLEQQEKLLMSIPVLEGSFCNELALPEEDEEADLEEICGLLGYQDTGGYVMIFSFITEGKKDGGKVDYDTYCHTLKHNWDSIVGIKKNCVIAYIFDAERNGRTEADRIKKKITKKAEGKGHSVLTGVGSRYDCVNEARKSYLEARHAVDILRKGKAANGSQNSPKLSGIVGQAEEYIQGHYAEPITLKDVADSVNLSQHYFSRFFKQEKGIGFADHLMNVRIDHAIELLLAGDLAVKEISYMVGFNDPNYFSKAFKKITGIPPGEYKKGRKGDM